MNKNQTSRCWIHVLLAAIALFLVGCDESTRSSYASAAEARADGAIRRGWLPTELPDSATDIVESHDLDTNTGSGSFRFEAVDADSFRAKLQPATLAQMQRLADRDQLQRDGYSFHVVSEFVLAVHWQTRQVRFVLNFQSP